jgi:exodeoxyribonuclease V alpha subunit
LSEAPPNIPGDTLDCTIERVLHYQAGSPFVVAEVRKKGGGLASVVGELGDVHPGTELRLHGKWDTHKKYGLQFRADTFQLLTPETVLGMERFLGGAKIPGIGPEIAKRIVARFGLETIDIIQNHPQRLIEVEGIGKVRAERLHERWQEQREVQDVMIFLQGHGVSPAYARRIYKKYGKSAIGMVRENPYRLALEVWGIGFKTADALAQKLGIEKNSPARAEAGLLHVLGELVDDGHCHVPEHELVRDAEKTLEVGRDILEPALNRLVEGHRMVREDLGDRGDCISLLPLWEAETRAAKSLAKLVTTGGPVAEETPGEVANALAEFEKERGITLAPQQRAAVEAAVREKVVVITGGPGVGKTTIVNAILRIMTRRARRLLLSAPTGRAAKRMTETTGHAAMTIHRLLEFQPRTGTFARDEVAPLEADMVIVDETSMLDTQLAARLFAAVPARAQLVLVGDVDQLPSVGPGRVLHDVISSKSVTVVRLTEIFRQAAASRVVTNAHRVNKGEMPELITVDGSDFYFIAREDPKAVLSTIIELVSNRVPRRFGFDPIDDVQVLSPMHRGDVGAQNLNMELQARLNPPGTAPELKHGSRTFRVGDKVIQLRNDYDKEVFNGDVGRVRGIDVSEEGTQLIVEFDGRDVLYEPQELEQIAHAFALTVHKSQGSEYPAVVIPVVTQHYMMLKRNLLYTAMTRGKRLVVLVGTKKAVGIAVRTDDTKLRWTWLARRIQDAVKPPPS